MSLTVKTMFTNTVSDTLDTLLFFTDFCLSYMLMVIINNFAQQRYILG